MLALGAATFNYLNQYSLEEALDHLAECGFRSIELMSTPPHMFARNLDASQRSALKKAIEQRGLQLVSLQPTYYDLNIISVNPAIREESIRQIIENIELAGDLGAKILVLVTGRRHPLLPLPMQNAWSLALDAIHRINEVARKQGVIVGIENVRNQFVDRGSDVRKMVEDSGDKNIRAVIDVANANMVESPLYALEAVKEYLVLVHLSDNDGQTWTHSPTGSGNIDFKNILNKLEEIKYAGPCILEVTYDKDPKWAMEISRTKFQELGWRL
ncbi:MAG: sugar phosphate isomerase/epimerase [Desulfobacterales bacterium]|nr:MAG: sugar phosphate isomerase/epimerase [Desulfobacterales bacterium]